MLNHLKLFSIRRVRREHVKHFFHYRVLAGPKLILDLILKILVFVIHPHLLCVFLTLRFTFHVHYMLLVPLVHYLDKLIKISFWHLSIQHWMLKYRLFTVLNLKRVFTKTFWEVGSVWWVLSHHLVRAHQLRWFISTCCVRANAWVQMLFQLYLRLLEQHVLLDQVLWHYFLVVIWNLLNLLRVFFSFRVHCPSQYIWVQSFRVIKGKRGLLMLRRSACVNINMHEIRFFYQLFCIYRLL